MTIYSPGVISIIVFVSVFGAALLGMRLSVLMRREHLDDNSKDIVRGGMAVVATMVALVLGLLVASAKGYFDTQTNEITQLSSDVLVLDRMFAHYGPQAAPLRALLKSDVEQIAAVMWGSSDATPQTNHAAGAEQLYDSTEKLAATTEEQRTIKTQVITLMVEVGRLRWLMYAQRQTHIPGALLLALVVWLVLVSLSSGLFARPNPTVVCAFLASALSVASAIWLIMEMYTPYSGFIRVPDDAVRAALAAMGS